MIRGARVGWVVSALLLWGSAACGETSNDDPSPGGAAGASTTGGATATATTSCPQQAPTHGTPCQGVLSCNYQAFIGCYPSAVAATCKEGRWDVPAATPYTGPCPGDPVGPAPTCPAEVPAAEAPCSGAPTLDGPTRPYSCEYTDPACVEPLVATCNGQWAITTCVPVNAGGAGGAAAGGEAAGGFASDGGLGGTE